MRAGPFLLLLLPLAAGGCDGAGLGAAAGVTAGSVAVIGRTPVDAVATVIAGRDCSAVRLDRGLSYCAPEEPPPSPPPYCTRSRGSVGTSVASTSWRSESRWLSARTSSDSRRCAASEAARQSS